MPRPDHQRRHPLPLDNVLNLAYETAARFHRRGWFSYHPDHVHHPFVVIIEGPETGCHPDRQRRLIPALTHAFPVMQFFAHTHSPFKAGQLHRVHCVDQDGAGTAFVNTNDRDITGWNIVEIMHNFMEMDDPTDANTADAAAELRGRQQLPKPQAQARQDRIDDLQRTVSREIETGGADSLQLKFLRGSSPRPSINTPRTSSTPVDSGGLPKLAA